SPIKSGEGSIEHTRRVFLVSQGHVLPERKKCVVLEKKLWRGHLIKWLP
ncbi:hypothetical protein CP061683_0828B, partial [Chlamydia psittaci 06-1683]